MARKKKTDNENIENTGSDNIYSDNIDYYYKEFCNIHNIKDIYKIPTTQFAASLIYICNRYIKPSRILLLDKSNGYRYNLFAVNALCDRLIYMCYVYNQPIMLIYFSYLSGIDYEYLSTWQHDNNVISLDTYKGNYIHNYIDNGDSNKGIGNIDIYNNNGLVTDRGMVTISRKKIFEKLVNSSIYNADSIALYKSGVNSIAYANRVHDRHDKTRNNSKPAFDMISVADSLGITDKLQGIEGKKKEKT